MIFLPTPGALVANRFRLRHPIGKGGMGQVWEAHDRELDSACAIKFILDHLARDPDARSRLVREARAVARLRSPHVVTILGVGEHADAIYLAMELLEGETLATRLERTRRLDPATTLAIVDQVVQVLDKAHAHGIVHRDLKPDNIWLSADTPPFIKVLDFGVAKSTLKTDERRTATGALMGTPHYMSPEQAAGDREVDHRSDLWALAVIAMECLSSRRPFESGGLGDLLMKIMQSKPPLAQELDPTLPPALNLWWQQALAHDLDERFQTASELALGLRIALGISASLGGASPFAETSRGTWGVAALPRVPTLVTQITPAPPSSPEPAPAAVLPGAGAAPAAAQPAPRQSAPPPAPSAVPAATPATLAVDSTQVAEAPAPLTEPMTVQPLRAESFVEGSSVGAVSQTTRGPVATSPRLWPFMLAGAGIGLVLLALTWWRLNEPPELGSSPVVATQPEPTAAPAAPSPTAELSVAHSLQPGAAASAAAGAAAVPEPRVQPAPSSAEPRVQPAQPAAPGPTVAPVRIAPVVPAPPAAASPPPLAPPPPAAPSSSAAKSTAADESTSATKGESAKSAPAKSASATKSASTKSASTKSAPAKSAAAPTGAEPSPRKRAPARDKPRAKDALQRRLGF